jgi:hypothetical protein
MNPRFQADADLNRKDVAGLRRREPTIAFPDSYSRVVIVRPDPQVLALAAREGTCWYRVELRSLMPNPTMWFSRVWRRSAGNLHMPISPKQRAVTITSLASSLRRRTPESDEQFTPAGFPRYPYRAVG